MERNKLLDLCVSVAMCCEWSISGVDASDKACLVDFGYDTDVLMESNEYFLSVAFCECFVYRESTVVGVPCWFMVRKLSLEKILELMRSSAGAGSVIRESKLNLGVECFMSVHVVSCRFWQSCDDAVG